MIKIGRLNRLTIKQKLTLLFIAFVIYPAIIVGVFGYFKYANDIRTELMKSLDERIDRVSTRTVERFNQTRRFAMMLPYDGVLNDLFLKRKDKKIDEQEIYNNITNYLYSKFYSKQEIKAVSFCFTDNPNVVYMVNSDNSYNQYIRNIHPIIIKEAEKLTKQYGYYVSDDGEIYVMRQMFDRFSFKQYGLITIKIDKNYMLQNFSDEFTLKSSFIMLFGDKEILDGGVFEDRNAIIGLIRQGKAVDQVDTTFKYKSDEIIRNALHLDNMTLQYGIVIPSSEFMGKYYEALRVLLALTLLAAIVLLLMSVPLYKGIWHPIKDLVELMKHLGEGNLGVQSQRKKEDEFSFIFESFNSMSYEIKHLFDVVYKEELARKEAQLSALQARINPHFLYNTLEIMNWKARIGGNHELSEMIEALGTLLDAGMDKGGQRIGRLSDELKLVDSYMYIMNKRFGKRLEYTKLIDESLIEASIPKLIIQPLLENAMVHGLEPNGGGKVSLTISRDVNKLVIEVADNGSGIEDKELEEYNKLFSGQECTLRSSTGIGVRNVHERISLIYGEEYGLALKKREEGGTRAIISIPLIHCENA